MKNHKINYDIETDSLTIRMPGEISYTDNKGDLLLDYDENNKLVGIELLDASKMLKKDFVVKEEIESEGSIADKAIKEAQ